MSLEFPQQEREKSFQNKIEITLDSEEKFLELEKWLKAFIDQEAAEQCVFVLRSMSRERRPNQCQAATQGFGEKLNERFGDEESFFDLVPDAEFSDVRSHRPLDKVGYYGDFHSVGMLEFSFSNKEENFSLIFDLTYGTISGKGSRKSMLIMHSAGDRKKSLKELKDIYGGDWKVDYELNKKTNSFTFYNNN